MLAEKHGVSSWLTAVCCFIFFVFSSCVRIFSYAVFTARDAASYCTQDADNGQSEDETGHSRQRTAHKEQDGLIIAKYQRGY
jgi:hypothetical protein